MNADKGSISWSRYSIGPRFYLALFVLFLLASAGLGLFLALQAGEDYRNHSEEVLANQREVIDQILNDNAKNQADLMDRAVQQLSGKLGREYENLPFELFDGRKEELVAYLDELFRAEKERNARNSEVIAGIFKEQAQAQADADLARSTARQRDEAKQWSRVVFRKLLGWGGAFLLVISLATGWVFDRLVIKPLGTATMAIEAASRGDLSQRLEIRGSDEIARLAESFNTMAAEISRHRSDLQERVDEKTAALSTALEEQQGTNQRLRAAMDELENAQKQLVESAKAAALGTMAQGMAHEFNNILGGIRGCAQDLLIDCQEEDQSEVLELIVRTAKRAQVITENLLSFSRGSSFGRSMCNLAEVVHESVRLVEHESKQRGIEVQIAGESPPPFLTDSRGLQQVFLNLLLNALQASTSGQTIHVRLASDATHFAVEIEDEGAGIPAADRSLIFDPFFSSKEMTQGSGGTGLGLSVSQGIMKDLGGALELLYSEVGRGSCFSVRIPKRSENLG